MMNPENFLVITDLLISSVVLTSFRSFTITYAVNNSSCCQIDKESLSYFVISPRFSTSVRISFLELSRRNVLNEWTSKSKASCEAIRPAQNFSAYIIKELLGDSYKYLLEVIICSGMNSRQAFFPKQMPVLSGISSCHFLDFSCSLRCYSRTGSRPTPNSDIRSIALKDAAGEDM